MALNKDRIKIFRKLLLAERVRVVDEIKSIVRDASTTPREASGDLSASTVHMGPTWRPTRASGSCR